MEMIDARTAAALVEAGALLVDIREPDEHARECIPGAALHPVGTLRPAQLQAGSAIAVVYHCRSGMRTSAHASTLVAAAGPGMRVCLIEGGLDAWRQAGFPVMSDSARPLELNRQVQIAAGSLVLIATTLGISISPWFHLLAGAIGAGLVFAGISGICGLAGLLRRMPWNRPLRTASGPS